MIRHRLINALALSALLASSAAAQEGPPPGPREGDGPPRESPEAVELRQQAIEQFDADDDGQLGAQELGRARAFLQALRREVGDRGDRVRAGDRRRGPRDVDPEGSRGPRPRGPADRPPPPGAGPEAEAAGGPPRPPRGPVRPMQLFAEFDADANGELNRDEFRGLMGAMRERGRPEGPLDGPPEGRRFGPRDGEEGRGPGRRFGPPPEYDGDDPQGPPPRERRERGRRPPPDNEESDAGDAGTI